MGPGPGAYFCLALAALSLRSGRVKAPVVKLSPKNVASPHMPVQPLAEDTTARLKSDWSPARRRGRFSGRWLRSSTPRPVLRDRRLRGAGQISNTAMRGRGRSSAAPYRSLKRDGAPRGRLQTRATSSEHPRSSGRVWLQWSSRRTDHRTAGGSSALFSGENAIVLSSAWRPVVSPSRGIEPHLASLQGRTKLQSLGAAPSARSARVGSACHRRSCFDLLVDVVPGCRERGRRR